eukprot:comp16563_c0_seq1/m.14660 comp16563_c0_seq1/g.14660  ORF comp16563_c0_seq1/g.14660 comp16563_c0_seq1/m.14660 type:complete len:218 (-) comp16563_c0_seq1:426-1079(-)
MATIDPAVTEYVQDVRNDSTETNWAVFAVEGKSVVAKAKGSTGREGLLEEFKNENVQYALLRTISGDQESRRTKFVFITWIGPNVSALQKGKAATLKSTVVPVVGQFHIEVQTDDKKFLTEEEITKKLKAAGGADYDTGSNKGGAYKSESGSIKAKALQSYQEKEKESNIGPIKYVTSALPNTTPVDLKGRPMVAPPSEAIKNMQDNVNDVDKWKSA